MKCWNKIPSSTWQVLLPEHVLKCRLRRKKTRRKVSQKHSCDQIAFNNQKSISSFILLPASLYLHQDSPNGFHSRGVFAEQQPLNVLSTNSRQGSTALPTRAKGLVKWQFLNIPINTKGNNTQGMESVMESDWNVSFVKVRVTQQPLKSHSSWRRAHRAARKSQGSLKDSECNITNN